MSSPDKRRSHGGTGSHVLRTGSSVRHAHHHSDSLGGGGGGGPAGTEPPAGSGSGSGSSGSSSKHHHLPAVPQRVAVVNNASTAADGATATADKGNGKEKEGKAKDTTSTTASSNSPVTRTTSASKKHLDKQRERERERDRERDRERESASLAAQVLQKDERIAYLEREMDTMERTFQTQLDRLSAAESETAMFWQNKHSALNTKHLRTDTELRLLRAKVDVREAERAELRQGWEVLRQGSEVLRRELKERDDEVRRLRGQVRGLKEWVSTSTRADGQTSDEVFGDGMTRLGNGLQNWVISNFRKAKLDLSRLDQETRAAIAALVPTYEELAKTAKVHFLQSLVSHVLVDAVFDAYFVGLSPEQTSLFKDMEQLLASFCGGAASESVNQWRASTLSLLLRSEAPQLLHDDTAAFAECVISRTNHLLDRLTGGTTSTITTTTSNSSNSSSGSSGSSNSNSSSSNHGAVEGARDAALRVLVNNSIELARRLVVQKAVLRVFMPTMRPPHERPVLFEASTMEDVGGGADDDEEDEDEDGGGGGGGHGGRWAAAAARGVVRGVSGGGEAGG
ncbi:uncharacterized protein BBA_07059 [Beauveria bassiana ARSEF 2860]|uniref:Uncharacterized protein n=1 Tax=Beauveria bassiana (strain ARSEF 2860) TaxID=655819 RepID=J4KMJ3_BEAB2|nr:uncharacterized protein BBA_07059 [Beauveria bassiana ARSEF 2860]EJP64054.1 hypothetical protein BBA_07059 [Beauveria bassiana ARSEF 2860]